MRQIKIKVIVLCALYILVMHIFSFPTQTQSEIKEKIVNKKKEKEEIMVQVIHNEVASQIPLQTYLEGVVASEMPYTFELEALKAQCVAARTFVLQRNLNVDDTTSSQVYRSENELIEIHQDNYDTMIQKIRQAVKETEGLVMKYNGDYISALFYSSNNGKSNDASWYYKNTTPYLKSVDSHWDTMFPQTKQTITMTVEEVKKALGVSQLQIQNITHYDNEYVNTMSIQNKTFTGREIREKLGLRSSCFSMSVENKQVIISTRGFGHGVGMSQYGAQGMAQEGYSFEEILKHYYSGIQIEQINR